MPLIFSAIGIVNDDATVALTIGDVHLVGLLIDKVLGRPAQVLDIIAGLARSNFADLHQAASATAVRCSRILLE